MILNLKGTINYKKVTYLLHNLLETAQYYQRVYKKYHKKNCHIFILTLFSITFKNFNLWLEHQQAKASGVFWLRTIEFFFTSSNTSFALVNLYICIYIILDFQSYPQNKHCLQIGSLDFQLLN